MVDDGLCLTLKICVDICRHVNTECMGRYMILIIDEDLGSQKYFNKILKKYDIKGKLIPNYQLYLKYNLHEQHFDYIIIDYDSGFKEFYESNISMLKEQNVALIILTQNILEERITQELKEINYSIIYKPLKFKDVINSLLKF